MGVRCFQICQIPDLSLHKYQSIGDRGVEGVLNRHNNFLRQWHGICTESETSLHLLYYFQPSAAVGNRLKLFFMIQGDDDILSSVVPLLKTSPLSEFYTFESCKIPEITFRGAASLWKQEMVPEIPNAMTGKNREVYCVSTWEMNASARLYDLFRMMETVGTSYDSQEPCAYRVDLFPVSVAEDTRKYMTPVMRDLQGDNDIQLLKDSANRSRNQYAQTILHKYEDWMEKVETMPMFRMNMYAFAATPFLAKVLLNAVGAEAVEEGDFFLAPIKSDANGAFSVWSRFQSEASCYCRYPEKAGKLAEWPTTFTIEEVGPFFRFPALHDGETIELPKETAAIFEKDGIEIGVDENGYTVLFPTEYLPKHGLFTGTPGSGKTNTMLHMVSELNKKKIPFLVMEPAKKEYRVVLNDKSMKDVRLFSPHLQSHFPLRMNPFAFPQKVRLSDHIHALMKVFQGSFLVEGANYNFLLTSLQKSYTDLGWDVEEINVGELPYPTMQDLYKNLEKEIDKCGYDGQMKSNLTTFLQVRLGSLMELDAGELFNTPYSTLNPEEWLTTSAIVELEVLDEKAKNFFVLLMCQYILESLRADPQGGIDPKTKKQMPVRHAMFIEEAHNIIAPGTQQAADSVDPKVAATEYIVKMLAEVRALREAIIIADQLPTALAIEVTKNTGLKLVHRLTAQDDKELIGSAISATEIQLERMGTFSMGKALIYHEKLQKPFVVQVREYKKPKIDFDYSQDQQLYRSMMDRESTMDAIIVAYNSWKQMYVEPLLQNLMILREMWQNRDPQGDIVFDRSCEKLIRQAGNIIKKFDRLCNLWCIFELQDKEMQEMFQEERQFLTLLLQTIESMR